MKGESSYYHVMKTACKMASEKKRTALQLKSQSYCILFSETDKPEFLVFAQSWWEKTQTQDSFK